MDRNLDESLKREVQTALQDCAYCGACMEACPVAPHVAADIGRIEALHGEIMDVLGGNPATPEAEARAFACAQCGACASACPLGIDAQKLQWALQAEIAARGCRPARPGTPPAADWPFDLFDVLAGMQVFPDERAWLTTVPSNPEPAEVVLYTGCTSLRLPDEILTSQALLGALGCDQVTVVGGNLCCGMRFLATGDPPAADRAWSQLIAALSAFQPQRVLFFCGSCYALFAKHVAHMTSLPFAIQHLSQYLAERVGELTFVGAMPSVVAVHDACGLGRRAGEYEAVRTLMRAIPGVTLTELRLNRENALCCGGGSDIFYPRVASLLRQASAAEIVEAAPDTVALTCSDCEVQFGQTRSLRHIRLEHYVTLLGQATGMWRPPKLREYLNLDSLDAVLEAAEPYINASPWSMAQTRAMVGPFFEKWLARARS